MLLPPAQLVNACGGKVRSSAAISDDGGRRRISTLAQWPFFFLNLRLSLLVCTGLAGLHYLLKCRPWVFGKNHVSSSWRSSLLRCWQCWVVWGEPGPAEAQVAVEPGQLLQVISGRWSSLYYGWSELLDVHDNRSAPLSASLELLLYKHTHIPILQACSKSGSWDDHGTCFFKSFFCDVLCTLCILINPKKDIFLVSF